MRVRMMMVACSSLLLSGCLSQFDMQGQNPKEYYKAHPIENKVEQRVMSYRLLVAPSDGFVEQEERENLRAALPDISPDAVEQVRVQLSPWAFKQKIRRAHIKEVLSKMGYSRLVRFEPLDGLARIEAVVEVTYNAVILPDCPDWRKSPVTTYSNHTAANFGCASTTNLGLMVANPKDLVHGSDNKNSNTERAAKAISDYRSGTGAAGASTGAAGQ